MRRLASWLPPVLWTGVIFGFAGESWSAAETGSLLEPLFRWLLPWATPAQIAALHGLSRKLAHLGEYGILALLWHRALGREGQRPRPAAWVAFGASLVSALIDEGYQATRLTRTGSALDLVLDAAGATLAIALVRGDWRRAVDRAIALLLWVTLGGGVAVLVVNALAGVHSVALWITTPAAAAWLLLRAWQRRRSRASFAGATGPEGSRVPGGGPSAGEPEGASAPSVRERRRSPRR